jgi:hypothetical protein
MSIHRTMGGGQDAQIPTRGGVGALQPHRPWHVYWHNLDSPSTAALVGEDKPAGPTACDLLSPSDWLACVV